MAAPTPAQVLPIWYRALAAELAIAVATSDKDWLLALLYEARKQAEDPELERIMICKPAPPFENELWLVKKEVELD